MCNAEEEGGPRNGVMTALDDFIAEHPRPLRLVIPIYFGLAIVVEEDRLAAQPELAAALDRLESSEGRDDLLQVAETTRLRAMVFQHNDHFRRESRADRAVARHLALLKDALLNEHYLENELRLRCSPRGTATGGRARRAPRPRPRPPGVYRKLERQRFATPGPDDPAVTSFLPYTAAGKTQLDHLEASLDAVRRDEVAGDLVECGTGRGGGAIFMRAYLDAHEVPETRVWVADHFRSSPSPSRRRRCPTGGSRVPGRPEPGARRLRPLRPARRPGALPPGPAEALVADGPERIALLRVGRSAAEDARRILDRSTTASPTGGPSSSTAGSARRTGPGWRSSAPTGASPPRSARRRLGRRWRKARGEAHGARPSHRPCSGDRGASGPGAAAPRPTPSTSRWWSSSTTCGARPHAPCTRSPRAYQEGIEGTSYEVIVVENGSADAQRLGQAFVADFGPEFRYIDIGDDAAPSPVGALNRGIAASRGRSLALMIDGAHVLTPGVLRFGLQGLATYAPAIVATQQWYVGPGQQGDAMDNGYDQAYEDRLFGRIDWPSNGYRLFEIGHFVGDRDWLDGVWESNCMFVTRAQLEQVGGFEERFTMPGGGYANLELYERLGSSPDVTVCTILGEGSFHQVHGGTTTNQADAEERRARVYGYAQHFAELRGRPFRGPGKPIHFVGRITTGAARRTKPRRLSTRVFGEAAEAVDGRPAQPVPMPDDLRWSFTEAVWRNLPWRRTTWLGEPVHTAPTDLLAYQEIITPRPPGLGGRDRRERRGTRPVPGVDLRAGRPRPGPLGPPARDARPFPTPGCASSPTRRRTPTPAGRVHDLVGAGSAVVVLGACADRATTARQFEDYAGLVGVGSYVVVTDTVVNGRPVWPAFGPGPAEGVKQILRRHGEFVADPDMEKYSLSFNPGGFLRRVR